MSELLSLEAVSRSFDGVAAVTGVSFSMAAGESVAVIGGGGSGKTTLLDLIAGALRPDRGGIRFDGREIAGLAANRVAALGIARVFDPPRPFPALSVEDNVIVGALLRESAVAEARRRAVALLEPLGLAALRHRPAAGLQPGARKRLDLARALATRPRLLLLDEMLAGASPDEAAALAETLREIVRRDGTALLLAEHDRHHAAALAGRILTLEAGALLFDQSGLGQPGLGQPGPGQSVPGRSATGEAASGERPS